VLTSASGERWSRACTSREAEVKREIAGNRPYPVVDTGELLRSVRVERDEFGAELLVTAPHAPYQEHGTGPAAGRPQFTPPFKAIEAWALRKQRGRRRSKSTSRKTKAGAGQPVTRRRGGGEPAGGGARVRRERAESGKAGRGTTKRQRRAAARAAKSMAGAVWQTIRRFGVKPKRYLERASKSFQKHVDQSVNAQVARVKD
jgi:hypothetical protein